MWFVFPRVAGLGSNPLAHRSAVRCREDAQAYLQRPPIGPRFCECCDLMLPLRARGAPAVFGIPDHLKLRSSLTLFSEVAEDPAPFVAFLDTYFGGRVAVWTSGRADRCTLGGIGWRYASMTHGRVLDWCSLRRDSPPAS